MRQPLPWDEEMRTGSVEATIAQDPEAVLVEHPFSDPVHLDRALDRARRA
jgi:hypothetical protein